MKSVLFIMLFGYVLSQENLNCENKTNLELTYRSFEYKDREDYRDDIGDEILIDSVEFANSMSPNCLFSISLFNVDNVDKNYAIVYYYSDVQDEQLHNIGSVLYPAFMTYILFYC
jgi:hypothetical protein